MLHTVHRYDLMTSFPKISVSAGSDINTDNFHIEKSFPECHFSVTENVIYVCIKGQKARKKATLWEISVYVWTGFLKSKSRANRKMSMQIILATLFPPQKKNNIRVGSHRFTSDDVKQTSCCCCSQVTVDQETSEQHCFYHLSSLWTNKNNPHFLYWTTTVVIIQNICRKHQRALS